MGLHSLSNIELKGIAACVPANKAETKDYTHFTEQEKSDFIKRVGIVSKRTSSGKYTSADLCLHAAESLLKQCNWKPEDVGLLILVTQTPDYILPSSAIVLQHRLGLPKTTLAFDLNLGCSGWVYGLATIGSLMQALQISKAILLTGETSIIADYNDSNTFPLMGDAGTATALEYTNEQQKTFFNLNSDGSGFDAILANESAARQISKQLPLQNKATLNPTKVLEFCLREVVPSVNTLLSFANKPIEEIDYHIFHQANKLINETLRKRLQIPLEKFPYSIHEFGNTSSASIPLTMVTQLREPLQNRSLQLLCSGFGVGLSWGTVLLNTNRICCAPLIELP